MTEDFAALEKYPEFDAPAPNKTKLLYHVNKFTDVYRLYILPFVAPDILTIAHGEGHLSFTHCYKIISCS